MSATDDRFRNGVMHELREGTSLASGWLETLFRYWERLDDDERRQMVAAGLFGANRVAAVLEHLDGRGTREIRIPEEKIADEYLRLIEDRA